MKYAVVIVCYSVLVAVILTGTAFVLGGLVHNYRQEVEASMSETRQDNILPGPGVAAKVVTIEEIEDWGKKLSELTTIQSVEKQLELRGRYRVAITVHDVNRIDVNRIAITTHYSGGVASFGSTDFLPEQMIAINKGDKLTVEGDFVDFLIGHFWFKNAVIVETQEG